MFASSSRRVLLVLACVALAAPAAFTQGPPARRAMTIDDVLDLVQVSAPRLAPDGRHILFTRSELGPWKDNKRVTSIWLADADGSNARRFLGSDKDRNAAWSPDGRHVAFISTRGQGENDDQKDKPEAAAQIWVIPVDGGEATQLTDHKGAVKSFEWTKDSASIVFVADKPKSDETKAAEKAGDDAFAVDEGPNGQERGDFAEVWRVGLADKVERPILREPLIISGLSVAPDAGRIAVIYRRENSRNGTFHDEVAVVDAATGAMTDVTHNNAPERDVQWSKDGRELAYLAPDNEGWDLEEEKLWVVPATGGTPASLTAGFKGSIAQYAWAPDDHSIVFGAATRGRGGVFRVTVPAGAMSTVTTGEWSGRVESFSADAGLGAAVVSTSTQPGDVDLVDLGSGRMTQVTHVNPGISTFSLAQMRSITWKSKDGLEIEGRLWLPADYTPGVKLPLILCVHGGPAGVWDVGFRGINEVYTGLGWALLEPNVRGSSSYGDALLRGNMKDIGNGDYEDLMTGVDKVIADGVADPDHLAIRGWSYGGILGGWTLTQTTRFKAASLGAMVTDWSSEYAMGFNHDVRLWYIGGTPWDNPEGYHRQSSYTHIAKVTTPTLLLHGERDTTDTIGQSMMYYQGLKDRGVPVKFIRFPREPHGFREPHHQRIRDTEEINWLMKYARGIDWKIPQRKDEGKKDTTTTTSARGRE
ncbi:MAG: prolyl oligopeptidase family serine peptidase [Betaproteobacteria bacterium]